jgi:hypothetical protein
MARSAHVANDHATAIGAVTKLMATTSIDASRSVEHTRPQFLTRFTAKLEAVEWATRLRLPGAFQTKEAPIG